MSNAFVGEVRQSRTENVRRLCVKTSRYLCVFLLVAILTTVLFYLVKPYYDFMGRKGVMAQSLGVVALLAVAIFAIILKMKGSLNAETAVVLILIGGYAIRLAYMLYTPVSVRQHDTYNRALTGHEAYAWIIYSTGKLPTTNSYQFYHPPLNAAIQAGFMHIMNVLTEALQNVFGLGNIIPSKYLAGMPSVKGNNYVGLTEYRYYLYSTTQILGVMWSFITMITLVKTLKLLGVKGNALVGISAVVVFFPRHIQFAGQVNNDAVAYMFQVLAIYFCLKWWKCGKNIFDLIICSLAIGFGMMSKISCAITAVPIGGVFIYEFILAIIRETKKDESDIRLWKLVVGYVVFLAICAPIGLWFQIYAYKNFGQKLGYVFGNLNHLLATDHHSFFERMFITFDVEEWFGTLYCIPFCSEKNKVITSYNNYNLWLYLTRSALFGEFSYKGGECFAVTAYACSLIANILLLASVVYAIVLFCKNGCKFAVEKNEIKNMVLIVTLAFTVIISEFAFYVKMPYACTQDFRYVMPLILGIPMIYYYSRRKIKAANTKVGNVLALSTDIAGAAVIVLMILFYCVCSA